MISQNDIANYMINEYAFLPKEYGFYGPIIKEESWSTRVAYQKNGIAIEVKLDFRELAVYLFVIRLENGELPKGYYLTAGKKSRIYLLQLISDRKWPVDKVSLQNLKIKTNRVNRDSNYFKEKLKHYHRVLVDCIDKILEENISIFN